MFVYRTSLGSQWLSKEDMERKTVEKLSDHEVKQFIYNIRYKSIPIFNFYRYKKL